MDKKPSTINLPARPLRAGAASHRIAPERLKGQQAEETQPPWMQDSWLMRDRVAVRDVTTRKPSSLQVVIKADGPTFFRDMLRVNLEERVGCNPFNIPRVLKPVQVTHHTAEVEGSTATGQSLAQFTLNSEALPAPCDVQAVVHLYCQEVNSCFNLEIMEMNRLISCRLQVKMTLNEEVQKQKEQALRLDLERERRREQRKRHEKNKLQKERTAEEQRRQEESLSLEREEVSAWKAEAIKKQEDLNAQVEAEKARTTEKANLILKLQEEIAGMQELSRQHDKVVLAHAEEVKLLRGDSDRLQATITALESENTKLGEDVKVAKDAALKSYATEKKLANEINVARIKHVVSEQQHEARLRDAVLLANPFTRLELNVQEDYTFHLSSASSIPCFPYATFSTRSTWLIPNSVRVENVSPLVDNDELTLQCSGKLRRTEDALFVGWVKVGTITEAPEAVQVDFTGQHTLSHADVGLILRSFHFIHKSEDSQSIGERQISVALKGTAVNAKGDKLEEIRKTTEGKLFVGKSLLDLPARGSYLIFCVGEEKCKPLFANCRVNPASDGLQGASLIVEFVEGFADSNRLQFADKSDVQCNSQGNVTIHGKGVALLQHGALGSCGKHDRICVLNLVGSPTVQNVETLVSALTLVTTNVASDAPHKVKVRLTLQRGTAGTCASVEVEVNLVIGDMPTVLELTTSELTWRANQGPLTSTFSEAKGKTSPELWFAADAKVTDPDTDDFKGGHFKVFLKNPHEGDLLSVNPSPYGPPNFIEVEGNEVNWKGDNLGTILPTEDSAIEIEFSEAGAATVAGVQDLLRAVRLIVGEHQGRRKIQIDIFVGPNTDAMKAEMAINFLPPLFKLPLASQYAEYKASEQDHVFLGPFELTKNAHPADFKGGCLYAEVISGMVGLDALELSGSCTHFTIKEGDDTKNFPDALNCVRSHYLDHMVGTRHEIYLTSPMEWFGSMYLAPGKIHVRFSETLAPVSANVLLFLKNLIFKHDATDENFRHTTKHICVNLDDTVTGLSRCFVEVFPNGFPDDTNLVVSNCNLNYRFMSWGARYGFPLAQDAEVLDEYTTQFNGGRITIELMDGGEMNDMVYFLSEQQQRACHYMRQHVDTSTALDVPLMASLQQEVEGQDPIKGLEIVSVQDSQVLIDGQVVAHAQLMPAGGSNSGRFVIDLIEDGLPITAKMFNTLVRNFSFQKVSFSDVQKCSLLLVCKAPGDPGPAHVHLNLNVLGPCLSTPFGGDTALDYFMKSGQQVILRDAKVSIAQEETIQFWEVGFISNKSDDDKITLMLQKSGDDWQIVNGVLYCGPVDAGHIVGPITMTDDRIHVKFEKQDCQEPVKVAQGLLARTCFSNDSENPGGEARIITFNLGVTGAEQETIDASCISTLQVEVMVRGSDDPTEFSVGNTNIKYPKGGVPIYIAADAEVTDDDTETFYNPAYLSITMKNGMPSDKFFIKPQGGDLDIQGQELMSGGKLVGTIDGQQGSNILTLNFSMCRISVLQKILRSVQYQNVSRDMQGKKEIHFFFKGSQMSAPTRLALNVIMAPPMLDKDGSKELQYNGQTHVLLPVPKVKSISTAKGFVGGSLHIKLTSQKPELHRIQLDKIANPQNQAILQGSKLGKFEIMTENEILIVFDNLELPKIRNDQLEKLLQSLIYEASGDYKANPATIELILIDAIGCGGSLVLTVK